MDFYYFWNRIVKHDYSKNCNNCKYCKYSGIRQCYYCDYKQNGIPPFKKIIKKVRFTDLCWHYKNDKRVIQLIQDTLSCENCQKFIPKKWTNGRGYCSKENETVYKDNFNPLCFEPVCERCEHHDEEKDSYLCSYTEECVNFKLKRVEK